MSGLDITELAKGAALERLDVEINRALENIKDPNTDWKKSRKVTLTFEFKAMDDGRESVAVNMQAKSSISPYNPVNTQIFIDKDGDGQIVASEFTKGAMKGQLKVDGDTGEIVEDGKALKGRKIVGINR